MKLNKLLKADNKYRILKGNPEINIKGIAIDSREVKPGYLFICLKGALTDGHNYINQAVENGAAAVVVEDEKAAEAFNNLTVVKVEDTLETPGQIGARFYNHPSKELTIIGVTGTKGKTTTVTMLGQVLKDLGYNVGTIGTLGVRYKEKNFPLKNTTPDGLMLQKLFREMTDKGITHVVMEVSSQAFKLKRTSGFEFDIGVLLNISPDHIGENEHKNFEEYFNCKRKIFETSKKVLVNASDPVYQMLSLEEKEQAATFSVETIADYYVSDISPFINKNEAIFGSSFLLRHNKNRQTLKLSVPGIFNVSNALAVLSICDLLGIENEQIFKTIEYFKPEGRMELLKEAFKKGRTVFVDFAHNKLSIESALKDLRLYKPKRILSLFGLHWNETRMRRYDQGYAAGKYSDYTVLTSDHKGPEPFEEIKKEVIRGLEDSGGNYSIIEDRKKAIEHIIEKANKDDIIVLFGMGHERIQKIDGVPVYFNEEEIVNDFLKFN